MEEKVRLLIWDLDETFWQGTLTEGGITFREDTVEIVKELARRGIISSICSKNSYEDVRRVFEGMDVWDYFVFPSINWEPKGPRIANLIDTAQLRPPTVMFIDDNPLNLSEAQHITPGLQVRSHEFVPDILASPLFAGKADPELKRLQQYKLLEQRKADEKQSGADIRGFLRASNIRVYVELDVGKHIERAVELINRTNQLNYTKIRLPEDAEQAKNDLRRQLASHEVQAGIVRVRDRYGDHGWCGIYMLHNSGRLLQYAFSCRVLGMGVETWLYNKLGRPKLNVAGGVLTDLNSATDEIDWIEVESEEAARVTGAGAARLARRIISRGGCDLMAVSHYFGLLAREVIGEFNENRIGLDGRMDHSMFLHYALNERSEEAISAAKALGYLEKDLRSDLAGEQTDADVWLLSFWTDAAYVLYRHRYTGLVLPFAFPGFNQGDARAAEVDGLAADPRKKLMLEAIEALKAEWEFLGFIDENTFKRNLTEILSRALPTTKVFLLEANEYFGGAERLGEVMDRQRLLNRWTKEVAKNFENVVLFNVRDFIVSESEVHTPYHFDRMVYVRIFEFIENFLRYGEPPSTYSSWAVHESEHPLAALEKNPSAEICARSAHFLLSEKRYAEAVQLTASALQLDPSSIPIKLLHAEAQIKSGNKESAGVLSRRIVAELAAKEISAAVLRRLADTLYESACYPQAEDMYRQACALEPRNWSNRHRLANALDRQGDKAGAYATFSSCMAEGDTNPHVAAHAGRLLFEMRRLDELEELLVSALAQHPAFPGLLELKQRLENAGTFVARLHVAGA